MRALLIGLILLLAIGTVAAANDFTGWVMPGEPFKFNGQTYYGFPNKARTSAMLETNGSNVIINLGTCQNIDFIRYCVDKIANQTDLDHIKFDTNNNILYGIHVSLTSLGPSLKVTQSYSTTHPDVNQEVTGTVTIKNTGNQPASYVTLAYTLEGTARIKTCSDCRISGSSFTKTITQLDTDKSQTVTFTFINDEPSSFNATSNVSFEYENTSGTLGPFHQVFALAKPYSVTLKGSKKTAVGDWTPLTLTIKNTGANPLMFNITPVTNASLSYQRTGGIDNTQLARLELAAGASTSYQFRTSATKAGTYTTGFVFNATRGSDTFHDNVSTRITYQLQNVKIIARLAKQEPVSGDTNTLYVQLQDTGSLSFSNLTVNATGIANGSATVSSISPGNTANALKIPFTHPKTSTRVDGTINITLSYATRYGETQNATTSVPYTVLAVGESYTITRKISPSHPAVNDTFTVTVYGTKIADSAVDYTPVTDTIIGARVTQGNTHLIPIESQKKELLYQYDAVRTSEKFAIITSVNASFLGQDARINDTYATFNLSELSTIEAVNSSTPADSGTNATGNSTTNASDTTAGGTQHQQTSSSEASKPGFIARIIGFLIHLFG